MPRSTPRSARTAIPASGKNGWGDKSPAQGARRARTGEHPADEERPPPGGEESNGRRKTLSGALTVLNKRERRIFETRRLAEEQITLVELAQEFGVSRERVGHIEVSAFEKVQKAVKHRAAAMGIPAPLQVR